MSLKFTFLSSNIWTTYFARYQENTNVNTWTIISVYLCNASRKKHVFSRTNIYCTLIDTRMYFSNHMSQLDSNVTTNLGKKYVLAWKIYLEDTFDCKFWVVNGYFFNINSHQLTYISSILPEIPHETLHESVKYFSYEIVRY